MDAQPTIRLEEKAHGLLVDVAFSAIRDPFLKTAQARGLDILRDAPDTLSIRTMNGAVTVRDAATSVRIEIAASDRARLFIVKEGVLDQLERQHMQLEMERQALAKEKDEASKERLGKVEKEIADL